MSYQIGPTTRMIRLSSLGSMWGINSFGVERLLQMLGVPVLRAGDPAEDSVLAMALETAMVGALLPGGPGLNLRSETDPSIPPPLDEALGFCPPSLPHWKALVENPVALQTICALGALLYGSQDEQEVKKRLWALADVIYYQATATAHSSSRRLKDSASKFSGEPLRVGEGSRESTENAENT